MGAVLTKCVVARSHGEVLFGGVDRYHDIAVIQGMDGYEVNVNYRSSIPGDEPNSVNTQRSTIDGVCQVLLAYNPIRGIVKNQSGMKSRLRLAKVQEELTSQYLEQVCDVIEQLERLKN